jgi:hypothetical protein
MKEEGIVDICILPLSVIDVLVYNNGDSGFDSEVGELVAVS